MNSPINKGPGGVLYIPLGRWTPGKERKREVKKNMSGKGENCNRARDLARGSYLFRVTEDILIAMEDLGITKSELANKLGISRPRISQLLKGSSNMTIGTLSDIAYELGLNLDKTFIEYSAQRYRLDVEQASGQSFATKGAKRDIQNH